jgi:hypothetical protein
MKEIEKLLERYYEGETSLEEEKALRDFFAGNLVPEHLQSHAAQFRFLNEARAEQAPKESEDWLTELETAPKPSAGKVLRFPQPGAWQVAASIALLIIGFAAGRWYNPPGNSSNTPPVTSADVRLLKMKNTLRYDQVRHTSASERIQAVNQVNSLHQSNQEITQLLINTMNFDDNVNVRLAACEALYRFKNEPQVREAFIQSLKIQTDPNLQITLIDILVDLKEKRAVDEIQRLIQDKNVLKVVRLKAEQGIGDLI